MPKIIEHLEERLMEEYTVKLGVCVRCRTFCVKMVNTYIMEFAGFTSSA